MKKLLVFSIILLSLTACNFRRGLWNEAQPAPSYDVALQQRNNDLAADNAQLRAEIARLQSDVASLQEALVNEANERVVFEAVADSTTTVNDLVRWYTYRPTVTMIIAGIAALVLLAPPVLIGYWYLISVVVLPRIRKAMPENNEGEDNGFKWDAS